VRFVFTLQAPRRLREPCFFFEPRLIGGRRNSGLGESDLLVYVKQYVKQKASRTAPAGSSDGCPCALRMK
jgi:hypothetical protein